MIALVTVLYKSDAVLTDFFKSLSCQSFVDYHLYLIDNSPSEATDEILNDLLNKYPVAAHTHIKNNYNLGVAAGNNLGIKSSLASDCTHTLLLNNDIVFDDTELLAKMYKQATEYDESLIVPKIFFHNSDLIWMAGGAFHKKRACTEHFGSEQKDGPKYEQPAYVNYAPTCFMLIANQVFQQVGIMREKYFVYYDDTDFIYRAVGVGYRIYFMPSIKIWHKESASTGGMASTFSIYYMNRNRLFFIKYNYTGFDYVRAMGLSLFDGLRVARKYYNRLQWYALIRGVFNGLVR